VTQVSLVEPDNTTTYKNLVIPPVQSFMSFMQFLQDRYGIYNEGMNYYMLDETMYIYPCYKTKADDCPETVHFYCTGDGSYEGVKRFHAKDKSNMYHIVINRTPIVHDLIDAGTENVGNAILFQNADRVIDLASSIGEGKHAVEARNGQGEIDVKEPNTELFMWERPEEIDYSIKTEPFLTTFVFTGNWFKYKSDLKSYRMTIVGFQWSAAEPRFVRPGYSVKWHIDDENAEARNQEAVYSDSTVYETYDGIVQSVRYEMIPNSTPKPRHYPFVCTATVALALDYRKSDQKNENTKTEAESEKSFADELNEDSFITIGEGYDNTASASNGQTKEKKTSAASTATKSEKKVVRSDIVEVNSVKQVRHLWSDGTITFSKEHEEEVPAVQKESNDLFSLT